MKQNGFGLILAGLVAGAVNGLFGAGGGMVLVPLLGLLTSLEDKDMFSGSVVMILPMCVISLIVTGLKGTIAWQEALPYLPGSALGGYLAFRFGAGIPSKWLHRGLGFMIIWGGIRYLC